MPPSPHCNVYTNTKAVCLFVNTKVVIQQQQLTEMPLASVKNKFPLLSQMDSWRLPIKAIAISPIGVLLVGTLYPEQRPSIPLQVCLATFILII